MAWEGWDEQDNLDDKFDETKKNDNLSVMENTIYGTESNNIKSHDPPSSIKNKNLDLNTLDIKFSGGKNTVSGEDDFFVDMEPAIPLSLSLLDILEEKKDTQHLDTQAMTNETVGTKFAVAEVDADTGTDGWGEDDWGEDF